MSRTKSGTLTKAVRGKSDAGEAGYRPLRDGVAPVPIDPGSPRETAAVVRELESFGAVTAPVEVPDPKRRMTQPGLFDALGVKV